jgi:hypothetical protein
MIDNVPMNLAGITYLSALNGIRNFYLGFVHASLDNKYAIKIWMILCMELSFMIFSLKLLKNKRFFSSKSKVWIHQFATLIRVLLGWTFLFDEEMFSEDGSTYE